MRVFMFLINFFFVGLYCRVFHDVHVFDQDSFQEVGAREIRRAKRSPPILNRNIEDGPASIYTIRTRSRRVNNGQALV